MNYERDSDLLKALGHPVRLKMLEGIMRDECHVKKIMKVLNIPQSTASQHIGILKNRVIVAPRKEGVKTCYRIADSIVREIINIFKKGNFFLL